MRRFSLMSKLFLKVCSPAFRRNFFVFRLKPVLRTWVSKCAVIALAALILSGCNQSEERRAASSAFEQLQHKTLTKRIAASSYPLVAIAESIAGEEYDVWMPANADKIPTAEEIRRLQASDVLSVSYTHLTLPTKA